METKPDTSALVKPREIQSAKRPPTCLGLALSGRDRWRSRPTASSSSRGWCSDQNEGALPPGSIGSVCGVSDRISAKARKQIARDVTNCRSVNGATGWWASRSSGLLSWRRSA